MNSYVKSTLTKLLILLIVLIISFGISIVYFVKDDYFKNITNSCRVLVSHQLNKIVNGQDVKGDYPYTIISLDGKVIKSTEEKKITETPLNNISFDTRYDVENKEQVRYSTPLIKKGIIEGIITFTIDKEEISKLRAEEKGWLNIIPIMITSLGILIVINKLYKLINKDILHPIKEMHKSAREILKGNYLERIIYDYIGEIGEFSHDFENMRDELKVSSDREQALKKAEKELLACISHDLKTPISNITGYCEGIIDGVVKDEKAVKRYAGIILKKARVLSKLLDDILEFSKAEINEMTIRKEEIYSEEFFSELLYDVSMDVVSSGREFVIEGEIPNLLINLDGDKIAQVINNIISNAVKYTYENGVVKVTFNRIAEGLEISISDNGVGIASDEIPLVFNKFYRGEKHRNQNIPGSGLGLSISKYIVEKHNGSITMISKKDCGTTVNIRIRN